MTQQALTYLAAIAVLCVLALVALAMIPGDQAQTETTLSTVLVGAAFGIGALVSPQQRPPGPPR